MECSEQKPSVCDTCYLVLDSEESLIDHRILCKEKKPSVCLTCHTLFKDEMGLTQHRVLVHQSGNIEENIPKMEFKSYKSEEFPLNETIEESTSANLKIEFMDDYVKMEVNQLEGTADFESGAKVKTERDSFVILSYRDGQASVAKNCSVLNDNKLEEFGSFRSASEFASNDLHGLSTADTSIQDGKMSSDMTKQQTKRKIGKIFQCNQCQKSFTTNRYLKQHTPHCNSGKKFICDKCKAVFNADWTLNKHNCKKIS